MKSIMRGELRDLCLLQVMIMRIWRRMINFRAISQGVHGFFLRFFQRREHRVFYFNSIQETDPLLAGYAFDDGIPLRDDTLPTETRGETDDSSSNNAVPISHVAAAPSLLPASSRVSHLV